MLVQVKSTRLIGVTFVIVRKVAKIFSRPFFLIIWHLVGVVEKTSVTCGKMFVPLQCFSEVGQLVLTLPVPSAGGPVASQERLVESMTVAPLLCKS